MLARAAAAWVIGAGDAVVATKLVAGHGFSAVGDLDGANHQGNGRRADRSGRLSSQSSRSADSRYPSSRRCWADGNDGSGAVAVPARRDARLPLEDEGDARVKIIPGPWKERGLSLSWSRRPGPVCRDVLPWRSVVGVLAFPRRRAAQSSGRRRYDLPPWSSSTTRWEATSCPVPLPTPAMPAPRTPTRRDRDLHPLQSRQQPVRAADAQRIQLGPLAVRGRGAGLAAHQRRERHAGLRRRLRAPPPR